MQGVEELIQGFIDCKGPSLTVVIVKDGRIEYENCFGRASIEYSVDADKNTIYDTGSLSKHFTGYAVAKFVKLGKISLEDPLDKYFNDGPSCYHNIKVKHLLYHTSGLPNYSSYEHYIGDISSSADLHELLSKLDKLDFSPGSRFKYCNTGYVLLAEIIEKITQEPFDAWLKREVFNQMKCVRDL